MNTVLIVEDNADWRELLAMILGRLGYEVFMALTGEGGVQKAFATQPHRVIEQLLVPDSVPPAIATSIQERSLWELRQADMIYGRKESIPG